MTTSGQSQSIDPRVAHYLDALNRALYGLPDSVHAEVYGEIRQHIDDQLAQRPGGVAAVSDVLGRLGDPWGIAREAGAYLPPPPAPPHQSRLHEISAVILLAIGGFIFVVGWIVGVVLLWPSNRFTRADKVIGTVLVPFGFLTGFLVLGVGAIIPNGSESCSSGPAQPAQTLPNGAPPVRITTTFTSCTSHGGHDVVLIAVVLFVVIAPLYTAIRLSRRVAAM